LSPATSSSISSFIYSPNQCISPAIGKFPTRLSDKRTSLSVHNDSSTILPSAQDGFFRTKNNEIAKQSKATIKIKELESYDIDAVNGNNEFDNSRSFIQEEFNWIIGIKFFAQHLIINFVC
jgi:hypothetical protein